ncbi:hypothetical protein DYB25_000062 [Aphanomyces astaci]|uniref:Uncharacterized protein n=1 Tax=Aphanomyces astaci TaxID=112090 RepID=A0A397AQ92_APHAT|nr:hypothetical protein DYB36_000018 [Aphanomyces astaci]RHY19120.1 hypothetical protein DYB25_000062 [Aphanomyces astaci]RHY43541.1 hypothetical protein DYB30_000268 [Aphanomyces astaci]RHY53230.1 hypothetical protein DYB38_000143 [Aphanomyces astaci]RHY68956.1 hypothetical protein DYB34_000414 [Aphanomyces astaci]
MAERSPSSLNGPPSRKLSSLAHTEYEDSADKPSSSLRSDRSVSLLDNRDAKVKKASPSDDAILKESLQVHNSSKTCVTTATTQLKVLCRKFAVLSEKVKQEAKMREDAEKEIRRLNDIIQEKTKQREMEQTTVAYEEQNRQDKDQLTKVTQHLRDVTMSHANELEKLHMRDAKQSHYQDMEALKAALYESQSAAHEAEKRALELQGELTAVVRPLLPPAPIAAIGSDNHSILRALKNRNKQLQERLQQEADATFQLEEEINMITSSYHTLLNPHD